MKKKINKKNLICWGVLDQTVERGFRYFSAAKDLLNGKKTVNQRFGSTQD